MKRPGRPVGFAIVGAGWIIAIAGFVALGVWQVERLAWKRNLISQVAARLAASPTPPPAIVGPQDAYRRVVAAGVFVSARDTFVQASTIRGPGWWIITPLRSTGDRFILINRGYVTVRSAPPPPTKRVTVTGLLRLTEPGGGFLRSNDPVADRWYSRDVAAIAARRGLGATAPYFIDADTAEPGANAPVAGLTVVRFSNNHLVYAITWFILAVMAAGGLVYWIAASDHCSEPIE